MTPRSKTMTKGIAALAILWAIAYFGTLYLGASLIEIIDFIGNGARQGEQLASSTYVYYALLAIVVTVIAVLAVMPPGDGLAPDSDDKARKHYALVAIVQGALTLAMLAYILTRPWQTRYLLDVHVPRSTPHALVFFGTTFAILLMFWLGNRPRSPAREQKPSKKGDKPGLMASAPVRIALTAIGTAVIAIAFALVLIPIAGLMIIGADNPPEGLFGHLIYVIGGLPCGFIAYSLASEWVHHVAGKPSPADERARVLKAAMLVAAVLTLLLILCWAAIWSGGHNPTGYRVPDMASYTITFAVAILVAAIGTMRLDRPEPAPAPG